VAPETARLCGLFGLDPLKLISSGAMLVTCPSSKTEGMIRSLADAGVPCARIGTMREGKDGMRLRTRSGRTRTIRMPAADEIHRV
jgi:hydrogenase maturation factor